MTENEKLKMERDEYLSALREMTRCLDGYVKLLKDAEKRLEEANKTIESLRRDIYEPSPDIQERVLKMYNHSLKG